MSLGWRVCLVGWLSLSCCLNEHRELNFTLENQFKIVEIEATQGMIFRGMRSLSQWSSSQCTWETHLFNCLSGQGLQMVALWNVADTPVCWACGVLFYSYCLKLMLFHRGCLESNSKVSSCHGVSFYPSNPAGLRGGYHSCLGPSTAICPSFYTITLFHLAYDSVEISSVLWRDLAEHLLRIKGSC